VSVSTVSRVVNDAPYVSAAARARVLEAIDRLGYRPNLLAQSLTTGRSRILGVIVADIEIPFFTAIARSIQDRAASDGFLTLVANSDETAALEDELVRAFLARSVDGIIVSPAAGPSTALREAARRVPIVLVDRRVEGLEADVVLSDNPGAAAEATSYLIGLGHRRIAYVTDAPDKTSNQERLQGFRDAFDTARLEHDPNLIWVTDYHTSGAERALRRLLATHRPTALLCSEGSITLGALRAARALRWRIPGDLSLLGFDQLDWSSATEPPLTVVEQQARRIGASATELILRRLDGDDGHRIAPAREKRIPTRFVLRESCAAP
jgi:LacI family transcriptional regulator